MSLGAELDFVKLSEEIVTHDSKLKCKKVNSERLTPPSLLPNPLVSIHYSSLMQMKQLRKYTLTSLLKKRKKERKGFYIMYMNHTFPPLTEDSSIFVHRKVSVYVCTCIHTHTHI